MIAGILRWFRSPRPEPKIQPQSRADRRVAALERIAREERQKKESAR